MINYLQDVSLNYPIGMLPDIITSNNQAVRDEFAWIFDSSLNRLTKSVYAPTGYVKGHLGEFVNVSTEYLTVKNTKSIEKLVNSAVQSAGLTTDSISYDGSHTLTDFIDDLSTKLNDLSTYVRTGSAKSASLTYGAAVQPVDEPVSAEPVEYQRNTLYMTDVQLKRRGITGQHLADVKNGNLYTYYQTDSELEIKAGQVAVIENASVGFIVRITVNGEGEASVMLDYADNSFVKIGSDPLNILYLQCVSVNADTKTCKWRIYNYSVREKGQLQLFNM